MKRTASVTDVLRNFSDYINRVAYRGEGFVLIRGGRPVAQLSPVPMGTRLGDLSGLLESLPRLPSDDVEIFASDLERARSEIGIHDGRDPWES